MEQRQMGRTNYSAQAATGVDSTLFLAKVFNWMAVGLGLTAVIAFAVSSAMTPEILAANRGLLFILMFAELGLVVYLSARVEKLSPATATALFLLYSGLNGITLSWVLLVYTATSVAATFMVTAGMFGAMAVYGFVTKRDLSSWGSFLFMGLIGIIIASVVNIFLGSSQMSWIISGIGVIVFTGLTAYDVQDISRMGSSVEMAQAGEGAVKKMAIIGALRLYLDFINLFLMLLRFLGDRD
ncbi:MAG: Bax inhibitor-1/YccA family protein [Thermodesulfobacteriota bacterium]